MITFCSRDVRRDFARVTKPHRTVVRIIQWMQPRTVTTSARESLLSEFEVFDKANVPARRMPTITVLRGRILSLNRAAWSALDEPEAVELLFDRANRVVGLRAVAPRVPHACFVRPAGHGRNGPYLVSAMAFIAHYGIDTSQSRRWPAWAEDDVLCISLNAAAEAVVGNRRRAG